jgi:DUF1009 family protein
MLSRFLPVSFSTSVPTAVLVGKGRYPELTIERFRAHGVPLRLVAFEDETAPELAATFPANDVTWIKVGQLGHMLDALKQFKVGHAIMVGQITPRKLFKGLTPDLKAVMIMATLKEKNAETIFGALAREVEKIGVTQLDARAFLDSELATSGCMTGWRSGIDTETLDYGIRIAKEIARLDIGQGVVVSGGTTIAVEAFEGTDKMLRRCADIGSKEPLFVKTVKPQQDYRFDVPCFGLRTLESMVEGGIYQAALEVGNVLVLDKENVIRRAKELGVTLHGYEIK